MKKTVLRILSILCMVAMISTMLLTLSSCSLFGRNGLLGPKDEGVYNNALNWIKDAEKATSETDAITKYEKAIEELETIHDYSETPATLEQAKAAHDKLVMNQVKYCYTFDYFETDDWLSRLYDQKKADSVTIWMDFSSNVLLAEYQEIVRVIKSNLKDPNSFKDVGSSYTYSTTVGDAANEIIVKKLTYKVDYTATNSFGAAVRDQFEYTFKDIKYTFDSEHLSSKEVAAVVKHMTFDDMWNSLSE